MALEPPLMFAWRFHVVSDLLFESSRRVHKKTQSVGLRLECIISVKVAVDKSDLVAIMFWLVGSFDRNANVVSLFL
jgi:hypothetical protein